MKNTIDNKMMWFNYKTGRYDAISGIPLDPTMYIPQDPAAQAMYQIYVNHKGLDPQDAMLKVLTAVIDATENKPRAS